MLKNFIWLVIFSLLFVCHPLQASKNISNIARPKLQPATYDLCRLAAARMEDKYNIRENLLQTISSVETGRWDIADSAVVSWPWTVNAKGKGMHFETKEEAVAAVKQLQAEGVESIDVGCMQISLKYHQNAFQTIEDALDPEKNVEYSAQFLAKLYQSKKNWQSAAMAYHSKTPSRGQRYKVRLINRFEKIKLAFADNATASLF